MDKKCNLFHANLCLCNYIRWFYVFSIKFISFILLLTFVAFFKTTLWILTLKITINYLLFYFRVFRHLILTRYLNALIFFQIWTLYIRIKDSKSLTVSGFSIRWEVFQYKISNSSRFNIYISRSFKYTGIFLKTKWQARKSIKIHFISMRVLLLPIILDSRRTWILDCFYEWKCQFLQHIWNNQNNFSKL